MMIVRVRLRVPDDATKEEILSRLAQTGYGVLSLSVGWKPKEKTCADPKARILNLLAKESPQVWYRIQQKLGVGSEPTRQALTELINEGKVIPIYVKKRGKIGAWYGVPDAENLKPRWEKFREILSDGAVHEQDVVIDLVFPDLPRDHPLRVFAINAIPKVFPDVRSDFGEYEGKERFVYFLKGSPGEQKWLSEAKKNGLHPLGQGEATKNSPEGGGEG